MKKVIIYPESFNVDYININNKLIKSIEVKKIFSFLLERYVISEDNFIRISNDELHNISKNHTKIIQYLSDQKIIRINHHYQVNKFTKSFLFKQEFKENIIQGIILLKYDLVNKPAKNGTITAFSNNHIISDSNFQSRLYNDFKSIKRIEKPKIGLYNRYIKDYFNPNYEHNYLFFKKAITTLVSDLKQMNDVTPFYVLNDTQNRLYTSFTNMKKEYRDNEFYFVEGKKLISIDIKSSHLLFLSILLLDYYKQNLLNKEEYFQFISLVTDKSKFNDNDNDIYNHFLSTYFKDFNFTRDIMKQLFFIFLNGNNETNRRMIELEDFILKNYKGYNQLMNEKFAFNYRSLYDAIIDIKKDGSNDIDKGILIKKLNTLEADFLFNKVIKRIYKEIRGIKIVTVHDQFYYSEENHDKIISIYNDEFNKLLQNFNIIYNDNEYFENRIFMTAKKEFSEVTLKSKHYDQFSDEDLEPIFQSDSEKLNRNIKVKDDFFNDEDIFDENDSEEIRNFYSKNSYKTQSKD